MAIRKSEFTPSNEPLIKEPINPAPGFSIDALLFGARGGPREPRERIRFEKEGRLRRNFSPGDQI